MVDEIVEIARLYGVSLTIVNYRQNAATRPASGKVSLSYGEGERSKFAYSLALLLRPRRFRRERFSHGLMIRA